ncbi:MAG TPA: hypothetical protein PLF13_07885 [candidate division Zixibacteria bacterium]|nr:hypothetical protein [candidate division Zixibacteria bacterium]
MNRIVALAGLCLVLLLGAAGIHAQEFGFVDTVAFEFSVVPDVATNELHLQADLWVFSDSNNVLGSTMGFSWDNPNLQMDSAVGSSLTVDNFEIGPYFYDGNSLATTNTNQRFVFSGSIMFGTGIPPADGRRHWATYYFTLSDWNATDQINLDTLEFGPSSIYKFVAGNGGGDYFPIWEGPYTIYDSSYTPSVNLIVAPDSLHFEAVAGGSSPASQSFSITTDVSSTDVTLTEDAGWLVLSPIMGTTPLTPMVSINIIGLSAGQYIDTILIESANAVNSPQRVVVTLDLQEPPPVISVSPSALYFNAIANGDNPTPKTLVVKNSGASVLDWTITNTESWLSTSPSSGTDSTNVTVSVDITGLAYGSYVDTLIVSDPNATNDPVKVPVSLSVGSDLPIIEVDSAFNTIIVDVPVVNIPDRTIRIKNGGGGALNFWLEESSSRIMTMTPSSGAADQDVVISFKIPGGTVGNDYYDTIWVNSNEAINSPFPVEFYFHYIAEPAWVNANLSTMNLFTYECSQGYFGIPQPVNLLISNLGGDNPMPFNLLFETEYFTVSQTSGTAPATIVVTPRELPLSAGTYLDTILVEAPNAINSPAFILVQYNVIEGTETPQIILPTSSYVIPTQENSGPSPDAIVGIFNRYGGCMPWSLVEDIGWLYPSTTSGDVPATVIFNVNSTGYPFGEYVDTFYIDAPDASNSPKPVSLKMRVWRFHGDVDYDGLITIKDLVYLVMYMFYDGPAPQPTLVVGDMNCNLVITIEDLIYLVDYMFNQGPIPCGNPY